MGLFEKLTSLLGLDGGRETSSDATGATVTVEREPSAESEHAVKGTGEFEDEAGEPEADDEGESADAEPAAEAPEEDEEEGPAEDDVGEPTGEEAAGVEAIDGIGPTYAERLEAAGIGTVADLAAADAPAVAEAAQAGESRAEDWIAQAKDR